jgi:hypothetical protein
VEREYDVVVVGAGAAGIGAAVGAARNGARTLLVESESAPGGDLVTGLPILGACNARGEWVAGGVLRDLLERVDALGGYIGPVCDWRAVHGVCVDPEALRLVLAAALRESGVRLLLSAIAAGVDVSEGTITGVRVVTRSGQHDVRARYLVDATGDASLCALAGAPVCAGDGQDHFQPLSLVFRVAGVDFEALLNFAEENPGEFLLAESPVMPTDPRECARRLRERGYPYLALSASGSLLGRRIGDGSLFPCTAFFLTPTSLAKRELCVNATRLADVDATDPEQRSKAYGSLAAQAEAALHFMKAELPGCREIVLSAVAHRVGVRETRRIHGEKTLGTEAVIHGLDAPDGIARGAHHVDIHGSGTHQVRIPVRDGGSYAIPFGCLIPRGLRNLLAAGRCLSSTREANGSARVMGTCLATGEAAGTAAALAAARGLKDIRQIPVADLRDTLAAQGAIL